MGKLVGTSATYTATRFPYQRKSFYAAGRFWVFYSDGTDMVYKTSTDGINWAGPTTIRTCDHGEHFSIWFDEALSFLHYAYAEYHLPTSIFYRRGTPNSDGTMTWSDDEQTAVTIEAGLQYFNPFVSVDSTGSAWIGYGRGDGEHLHPFVTKSSTTTGTWVIDAGFPFQLSTVSFSRIVLVIPLTGGEMLAVYPELRTKIGARLWNGDWESEISTSNTIGQAYHFCAVAEGYDVHLVFISESNRLIYAKYDYSSNSFTAEKLLTGTYTIAPPVISIDDNNNLYVFWANYPEANTLYYLIYTAENDTWGPAVKWKSEKKIRRETLTCFYKQYSGYTGLAYTTEPSPGSYAVKFNYIASQETKDPTPEPVVVSNTLTSGGSRHTTPAQGSVGTKLSARRRRLIRHITWVPVVITRA